MSDRPVLVIDNDAEAIALITDTLRPLGYSVVSAVRGDEGLRIAKEQTPSLILINLSVPNTDGLKICKSLMSIIDAPIILLTLREGKYDPRYRAQYGIVEFIKKPINKNELASKVGEFAPVPEEAEVLAAEDFEGAGEYIIPEEEVPSASELEASIASYAEGEEPLTPVEEAEGVELVEAVEAIPEEELAEAVEAVEVMPEAGISEATEEIEDIVPAVETTPEEEFPEWTIPEGETAGETQLEETSEWAMPEEPLEEPLAEEKTTPWPMPEEGAVEEEAPAWPSEEPSAPEEVPEWSLPEDRPEEISSEEEPPDWSLPEEALEKPPASREMDWSFINEETPEKPEMPKAREKEDLFASEEETVATAPKEDAGFAEEDKEYEVRPAALERHKRRKSKSTILVPLVAILVILVAAGGMFFFFISGKKKTPAPAVAPMREARVTEKAVPEAPPLSEAQPAEPAPKSEPTAKQPPAAAAVPVAPTAPAPAPAAPAASAAPEAPAAPEATAATAPGRIYFVQFGAFRSKDNAVKLQNQLKASGYDTFIRESTVKGQPLFLVLLSDKYSDKWIAFKQARQIKSESNIGTSVYSE